MSRKLLYENYFFGIDSFGDEYWELDILEFGGCI